MNTLAPDRTRIRCQNCPATFNNQHRHLLMSDTSQARAAGWTIWSGTTMGGRDETRTYCPNCSGRTEPPDNDEPGWDAACDTCDARATEDWSDETPLSQDDVDTWKTDHQCEPDVRLIRPEDTIR